MTSRLKMKGAQAIVASLEAEGCDTLFGFPGGVVIPLYDALYDATSLRHILVRHEQGAVHAADGYARATGKVGVCLATSGPGATNLVTGIANAYLDSIPLVAITGQVRGRPDRHRRLPGGRRHRHHPADRQALLPGAERGRDPAGHPRGLPHRLDRPARPRGDRRAGHRRARRAHLPAPRRPAACRLQAHGQGPRQADPRGGPRDPRSRAAGALRRRRRDQRRRRRRAARPRRALQVPVTTTLMGLGAFDERTPLSLGMLGMHGTVTANYAVHECDLLIAVGARFDDRVTGKLSAFAPQAKAIIHIDVDPAEIGKNVEPSHPHRRRRPPRAGRAASPSCEKMERPAGRTAAWLARIEGWKAEYPLHYEQPADGTVAPQFVDRRDRAGHRRRRRDRDRRGPAPDVVDALLPLPVPAAVDQLRRSGHHGLRPAGGDRRQARPARQDGDRRERRRRLSDDHAGARHGGELRRAGRGGHPQQRLPRHGAPVAGPLLEQALLVHLHRRAARLRHAGRGVRRQGHARDRVRRRRRRPARGDRQRAARR